jgi:two-component system cell cycle sensor histidine kinase PleC
MTLAPASQAARFADLLDTLVAIASLDFSRRAAVGTAGDELDAVALGLNMLAEELAVSTVAKADLEGANARLLASERRLQLAVQVARLAVIEYDSAGKFHVDNAYAALFGYAPGEAPDDRAFFLKHVQPDDLAILQAAINAHLAGDAESFASSFRITTKSGESKWLRSRGRFIPTASHDKSVRGIAIVADITAKKHVQDALAASEARFRGVFDASGDAMFVSVPGGRVLDANPVACRLLGMSRDELVRQSGQSLFETVQADPAVIAAGSESGAPFEVQIRRADGTVLDLELVVGYLADGAESRVMVSVVHDVTERRRMAERLRSIAEQEAAAHRMKSDFLATTSHELRNPLSAILGFSDALLDGLDAPLTAQQADYVREIATAGRRMRALVEDLLISSQLRSDAGRSHFETVDLGQLAVDVVSAHQNRATKVGVALTSEVSALDLTLLGDGRLLALALRHLLQNALRHTPAAGNVRVEVARVGDAVEFTVADSGPGIAPELRPLLFQPLTQLSNGRARQNSGAGMGLAIVRQVAEHHLGTVGVHSDVGVGSRFWLRLPRTIAPARQTQEV